MADEEDRQPPQAYDTVTPAGVGAATSNQMSPRAFQDLYLTGDQGLLDVAMEEMGPDALHEFLSNLPSPRTVAGWPDVGGAPPVQTSTPAGVGSSGSQSFRSPQTTPESSGARTPATPPSVPLAAAGARTAAGAGGNGGGRGGGRGGRGGGRGGRGGGRGGGAGRGGAGAGGGGAGAGGAGGAGGGGAGGAGGAGGGGGGSGGAGGGGGGGGRRGRRPRRIRGRRRNTPTSPLTPASNPASFRGSWSGSIPPRTLRQADLQRRLRMLLQDQEQLAQGREIANVTMTNSIVTSYKQGGRPSVQTSSSRVSP